jgi:hypothetical protein
MNVALAGGATGYALGAWMHVKGWKSSRAHALAWVPAARIVLSVVLGTARLVGVTPAHVGHALRF